MLLLLFNFYYYYYLFYIPLIGIYFIKLPLKSCKGLLSTECEKLLPCFQSDTSYLQWLSPSCIFSSNMKISKRSLFTSCIPLKLSQTPLSHPPLTARCPDYYALTWKPVHTFLLHPFGDKGTRLPSQNVDLKST